MPPAIIAKLAAPRATRIVRRTRVLSAIDRGLRTGACWIAAPAGYGKTLAVTEYLQRTKAPYVWYRVDEDDQDVASFFHYMTLSMQGARVSRALPAFGPEYGDQPLQFARRFFRAYLAKLRSRLRAGARRSAQSRRPAFPRDPRRPAARAARNSSLRLREQNPAALRADRVHL
jgi:ATP/maltotriose-dependent transcriptional regulator MalT